MPNLTEKLKEG